MSWCEDRSGMENERISRQFNTQEIQHNTSIQHTANSIQHSDFHVLCVQLVEVLSLMCSIGFVLSLQCVEILCVQIVLCSIVMEPIQSISLITGVIGKMKITKKLTEFFNFLIIMLKSPFLMYFGPEQLKSIFTSSMRTRGR